MDRIALVALVATLLASSARGDKLQEDLLAAARKARLEYMRSGFHWMSPSQFKASSCWCCWSWSWGPRETLGGMPRLAAREDATSACVRVVCLPHHACCASGVPHWASVAVVLCVVRAGDA